MNDQEAVPSEARLIDLPAEDAQSEETAREDRATLEFAESDLYQRIIRVKLEDTIDAYAHVRIDPHLSDKEIADAVRLGQVISIKLQEILDDIDRTVGFYRERAQGS